jgi:hypothetical protein
VYYTIEPTCGWMVSSVRIPLATTKSNPRFDILRVSLEQNIFSSGILSSRRFSCLVHVLGASDLLRAHHGWPCAADPEGRMWTCSRVPLMVLEIKR